MFKKAPTAAALLLASLSLAAASGPLLPPAPDEVLQKRDHQKVGESIATWLSARKGEHRKLGSTDAKEELRDELEKWRKKRGVDGRDPLSLTDDLGAALWFSYDYAKAKGIKKGKVARIESQTKDGRTLEYALWAPSRYNAKDGPYPLVLCLPDAGETVTEHLTERWINSDIRDSCILACVPLPEEQADWTERPGMGNFFAVMLEVSSMYAVDFDRVFVVGHRASVPAAMTIASRFPDRFAGVIGRAGDAAELAPQNFRNLPCFFAGGGGRASAFKEACKKAGHENVTLMPDGLEEDLWAWMQEHPRSSNPVEVVLLPGTPLPNKAYWVEVPPHDGQTEALLSAKIDRAQNKITVEATGITEVTLFFNDDLLDMDAPIQVVCNGIEHEDLVPRNFETWIELIWTSRNDPGKTYTGFKSYDIPASRN